MEKQYVLIFLFILTMALTMFAKRLIQRGNFEAKNFDWMAFIGQQIKTGGSNNYHIRDFVGKQKKATQEKFSEHSVRKAAAKFGGEQGYVLSFDTNVLIDHPNILNEIANDQHIHILISQMVRIELDGLKKNEEVGKSASFVLKSIYQLSDKNVLTVLPFSKDFTSSAGMDEENRDSLIIGSYLKWSQENPYKKVLYISSDTDARFTAKTTSLTVLELYWEDNVVAEENNSESIADAIKRKVRPGYTFKLAGIICISLAFGVAFSSLALAKNMLNNESSLEQTDDQSFSNRRPFVKNDTEYFVKSEYGSVYKGQYSEDFGGIAIVDMIIEEADLTSSAHTILGNNINVTFAGWFNKKTIKELNEKYKMVLKLSNGETYENNLVFPDRLKDSIIKIESLGTNIQFTGLKTADNFSILHINDLKFLDGASFSVIHRVTGENIFTIPAKVQEVQLENEVTK